MPPTTSSFVLCRYKGSREGGIGENASYYIFLSLFFVDTKGVGKEGSERMLPTTSSFVLCRYKGSWEGGIGENASYYIFLPSL